MDPNLPATDGFFDLSFLNIDNVLDTGDIVNVEELTAPTDNQEFNYWYPEAHPQIDEPLFRNPTDVQRVPNQQSTGNASPELALAEVTSYINWDGIQPPAGPSLDAFQFGRNKCHGFTFENTPSSGGRRAFTGSFSTHFNQKAESSNGAGSSSKPSESMTSDAKDESSQTQDFMADVILLHPGDRLTGTCLWLNENGEPCGRKIQCSASSKLSTWRKHCLSQHPLPALAKPLAEGHARKSSETTRFVTAVQCQWKDCFGSACATVSALEKHLIAHLGYSKWTCRRCDKTLARCTRSFVGRHMRSCKGQEPPSEPAPMKRTNKRRRIA